MLPFENLVIEGETTGSFSCHICGTQDVRVLFKKNPGDDGRKADGKLHNIGLGMFRQVIKNKFSKIKG